MSMLVRLKKQLTASYISVCVVGDAICMYFSLFGRLAVVRSSIVSSSLHSYYIHLHEKSYISINQI